MKRAHAGLPCGLQICPAKDLLNVLAAVMGVQLQRTGKEKLQNLAADLGGILRPCKDFVQVGQNRGGNYGARGIPGTEYKTIPGRIQVVKMSIEYTVPGTPPKIDRSPAGIIREGAATPGTEHHGRGTERPCDCQHPANPFLQQVPGFRLPD